MSSEEMQKKLAQLGESNKKNADYENKMALFSQEIERLNGVVEKKNSEVTNLNRKMHEID